MRTPASNRRSRRAAGLTGILLLALPGMSVAARLDLAGCVKLALSRNPQLLDAFDAEESARIGVRVAESKHDLQITPTIDGGVQGANTTNQRYEMLLSKKFLPLGTEVELKGGTRVFSTVPQVSVPYFSEARVTIAQPLFQGWTALENRRDLDDAERRLVSSQHAIEVAREDAVFQVVRAYYDVVRAAELLAVAESSLAQVRELKGLAESKLELGKVSKMDVYRSELQAARIENTLADQRARHAQALDELKILLGLDPRIELTIEQRIQGPSVVDLRDTNLEQEAQRHRAEVREARQDVEDAERGLVLARYGLWPSVDLVGFFAQQGTGNSLDDSFDLDRSEWNVGIRSSVPLDRTEQEAQVSEAEIALRGEERRYRLVQSQVVQEVRSALRQLERAESEMELADQVKVQAEQQRELAKYRYDRGVTDNFDLVQAEEQLTEARAAHLLAVIDRAVAAAAVRRTAGTLTRAFVDLPDEIAPSPDALEPLDRRPGAERPDRCASGTPGKCDTED